MAIVRVQSSVGTANASASCVVTLTTPPVNGDTLIMAIGDNSNKTVLSIVQAGAVWVPDTQNSPTPGIEIWRAPNVLAAGTTITITKSGVTNTVGVAAEYSGLVNVSTVDKFVNTATGNSATPDSGTTTPTTAADELWFGAFTQSTAAPQVLSSPTNLFSIVGQGQDSGNNLITGACDNIVGATGMADVSITSSISAAWVGVIVTYIGVPVAPSPPTINFPINRLVSDYITELRNRFAEINFVTWIPDQQLISWMNQGVDDIAFRTLPPRYEVFPPIQFPSVGGQTDYSLPNDFFRLKEFGDTSGLFFNGDALLFEDKTAEMEQFQFGVGFMPTNQPIWFWFWGGKVFMYPPPADNTGIIKMYYYRLPAYARNLTDAVDVDRPWEEVLIKFVLWKSLEKDKHPMSQIYRQEYEQALSNQYSESRIRVEKRARYVHSHDFWGREDR